MGQCERREAAAPGIVTLDISYKTHKLLLMDCFCEYVLGAYLLMPIREEAVGTINGA